MKQPIQCIIIPSWRPVLANDFGNGHTAQSALAAIVKLPSEHDAAEFNGPAAIGLADATFGFEDRPITVQLDHGPAVN